MKEMWVIYNPGLNAVGIADNRINPERRLDLQVEGTTYIVVGQEEKDVWDANPRFLEAVDAGILVIEKTDKRPVGKPAIPDNLKPRTQYDQNIAREIALSPLHDVQISRINLFRGETDEVPWREDADITYLRTRHRQILQAAEWWLTKWLDKRTAEQNKRLSAIRTQLAEIKRLG